jgi:DNA repair protein RadC
MSGLPIPSSDPLGGHQVRELVVAYRPARYVDGRILRVPSLILSDPRAVARVSLALLAGQPVEVFAVACLSTRHRLLAWHLVARGTRDGAAISVPDVFVPACVTPGTTALVTVHNHPSGDSTPSPEDEALTTKLCAAAALLDLALLDHVIVGDEGRYYSFREAGQLGATPAGR